MKEALCGTDYLKYLMRPIKLISFEMRRGALANSILINDKCIIKKNRDYP